MPLDPVINFADDDDVKSRTICVDFDGVIAEHSNCKDLPDKLIDGAEKGLGWLNEHGWEIIIFTCREDNEELRSFLSENSVPFDHINHQPNRNHPKPLADVYLDDRAIEFDGDWGFAIENIENFCPWHKKKTARLIAKIKETRHYSCKTCEEPILARPIQYLGGWYHMDCLMPSKEAFLRLAAEDSFNPAHNAESEIEDPDDTRHRNDTNQKEHKDRRKNYYNRDDINEVWPIGTDQSEYPSKDKQVHKPSRIYN